MPRGLIQNLLEADPALARRVRRMNPPRIMPPDAVERSYIKALEAYVSGMEKAITPSLMRIVKQGVAQEQAARARADADWLPALTAFLDGVKNQFNPPQEQIDRIAKAVAAFNKNQVLRFTRSVLGVNLFAAEPKLEDTLAAFSVENAALITTLRDRTLERIREVAQQGVTAGRPSGSIAKEIGEQFGIEARHARLIARDQVSKLNGQLTMTRQTALGITHYKWRTAGDDRVRQTHHDNNNQIYSWDAPPATGHPGQDYQCRCWASPVLEEFDEI